MTANPNPQRGLLDKVRDGFRLPIVKYYLSQPIDGLRYLVILFWEGPIKRFLHLDPNFDPNVHDDTVIDVVIPTIEKDFDTFKYVLPYIKKNLRHPIGEIIVVCPPSKIIESFCAKNGCRFVNENTVLPITIKDIHFTGGGVDRSGWIFQQLLKWSGDTLCKNEFFLIADSDTVLARPQVFRYKGKVIMPCGSDPCHLPYYRSFTKLLGEKVDPVINFTCHHSLFSKSILRDLKDRIEKEHHKVWYEAILSVLDPNEGACISEYGTYGQFVFRYYRDQVRLEHWCNLSLPAKQIKDAGRLTKKYGRRYKAISFHSYNS